MIELTAFANFESAGKHALKFLHHRLGFDLWMITRRNGDDCIILHAEDQHYGVKEGSVMRWADTFCSQMVLGNAPTFASSAQAIPAYAQAPIGKEFQIGSYIGLPLMCGENDFFGTLCAVHPASMPESLREQIPLVEFVSRLLSSILNLELKADAHLREFEQAMSHAVTDPLTGLFNRRGWDEIIAAEESRCQRYGHSACVISIDLDGLKEINDTRGHAAGDDLILRAGKSIHGVLREHDIAARLGGDEFAILAVECSKEKSAVLIKRVEAALAQASIKASVGSAIRSSNSNLSETLAMADQAMYAQKKRKPSSREIPVFIPPRAPTLIRRSFE